MPVYSFINQKGGVGKSTLSMNIAATLSERGSTEIESDAQDHSPVLLVSVDPQGSAVWWADRVDNLPFRVTQTNYEAGPELIRQLPDIPGVSQIIIDTPGWIEETPRGPQKEVMDAVLDITDLAVIPMQPSGLSYVPTARTINKVVAPRRVPYLVAINDWDPRDGTVDLEQTQEFVRGSGWPLASSVIRRYKVHSRAAVERRVVTEYPMNRVGLHARNDFQGLSLDLSLSVMTGVSNG